VITDDDWKLILCTDLNNDGLSDLVLSYEMLTFIDIFLSQNDSVTQMKKLIYSHPLIDDIKSISAGDFNQDGHVDLAMTPLSDDGILIISQGRGDGTFGLKHCMRFQGMLIPMKSTLEI
jgi:hypothetical protein